MPEEFRIPVPTLADGEMKQVPAGPTDVLLINLAGTLHAVEPLCPHYRQPLADGLICHGQLRCGWHQSVFDIASGDVLEPPALTGLKQFPVRIDGDDVLIDVASYRTDRRRFVIIGGGAAGFSAAKTLRENGFQGELTLISADRDAPYDRPNLSKDFLAGLPLDAPLALAADGFFQDRRIDLRLDTVVHSVDRINHLVRLADSATIPFDKLLIATGARPRTIEVPNKTLPGIFTLRSLADAKTLIDAARHSKHAVIIGGSFIAMEVAAALRQRKIAVTVVMRSALPLQSIFGDAIATMIREVHEKNGIEFQAEHEVKHFEGDEHLKAITLDNGIRIACDLAVVAVGVEPNTTFLQSSFTDLMDDDGGLRVNRNLQLTDNIYAAGDVARVDFGSTAWNARIEHWRVAEQLGSIAAHNMMGDERVFEEVPYFWTYQFDVALDYIGHASAWDEVLVDGDVQKQDFIACYVAENQVTAACVAGRSAQACAITELMKRRAMPAVETIRGGGFDYAAALRRLCLPSAMSRLG